MTPFARTYRVRGYEVDGSRTMPVPVALSFLEQLRWEWMVDPEWGLDVGVHDGYFFVVRKQVMELVERPRFGELLTVEGRLEKVGRSQVIVQHQLSVGDRIVGHARVQGVWLGPNRRLARIPDLPRQLGRRQAEEIPAWEPPAGHSEDAVLGDNPSFLEPPRRVYRGRGLNLEAVDFEPIYETTLVVRPSECDVFQHVNASQYLRYCEDARFAAGQTGLPNTVFLDYAGEALSGDALRIESAPVDGVWQSRICRGEELLCRVVMR